MKTIEISVDQGKLIIPADLLEGMGLVPDDTMKIARISKLQSDPRKVSVELLNIPYGFADPDGEISLPNELLEAADIPLGGDIEITCTDGAIIITEAEHPEIIPAELCRLFAELGINPETVRSVIRGGGVLDA